MPDRLLDFILPPKKGHGEDGVTRWRWAVSIVMYAITLWICWAMGWFAVLGLGSGLAKAGDTEDNRAAIQSLQLVVKCGYLQSETTSMRTQAFNLERQIEMDQPNPRATDLQRLNDLRNEIRDNQFRSQEMGCAMVLR